MATPPELSEDAEARRLGPLPLIILVASLVGGLWFRETPLRPYAPAAMPQTRTAKTDDVARARLWEDPFEAALRQCAGSSVKPPSSATVKTDNDQGDRSELGSWVQQKIEPKKIEQKIEQKIAVSDSSHQYLVVLVDAAQNDEATESRLRERYAVVSALGVAGFEPYDPENVLFYPPCGEMPRMPLAVMERYETSAIGQTRKIASSETLDRGEVVVLWMLEPTPSTPAPLPALLGLTSNRVAIIGPRSSDGLVELEKELQLPTSTAACIAEERGADGENRDRVVGARLNKYDSITFYSPSATRVDVVDTRALKPAGLTLSDGVIWHQTIGTDAELVTPLIDELELRGVPVRELRPDGIPTGKPLEHVALISEWDTRYGRALPETFAAGVLVRNADDVCAEIERLECDPQHWPRWIHHFSYLRGLAAEASRPRVQRTATQTSGEQKTTDSEDDDERIERLERPLGPNQLDYLRRLASSLKRERPEGYGAIGVLGSDVTDKLLVLQALRRDFPGTLFFTTDMDARLIDKTQRAWTHNLIVVSHFGLELNAALQNTIPPFRDSYQTSEFFATLQALGFVTQVSDEAFVVSGQPFRRGAPRRYEVSRSGAFDLSPDDGDGPTIHRPKVHPRLGAVLGRTLITAPIVIIIAFVLSAPFSERPGRFALELWLHHRARAALAVASATLLALGVASLIYSDQAAGEPFVLWDGISLWPVDMLRFVAGTLAVGLICQAVRELDESRRKIQALFLLQNAPEEPTVVLSWSWRKLISITNWSGRGHDDVGSLSGAYAMRAGRKARLVRAITSGVLFFVAAMVLIRASGSPSRPYRGELSNVADQVALYLSVLPLIGLVFLVVDASRLSRNLIERLARDGVAWSAEARTRIANTRGMLHDTVDELLTMRLIAAETKTVGRLIYYPFVVIGLMILARTPYFDNLNLPMGLLIVIGLNVLYALAAAVRLQRVAIRAREALVRRLQDKLVRLLGIRLEEHRAEQVRHTIEEIQNNREGAFRPIYEHPALAALALPSASFAIVSLLEHFTR